MPPSIMASSNNGEIQEIDPFPPLFSRDRTSTLTPTLQIDTDADMDFGHSSPTPRPTLRPLQTIASSSPDPNSTIIVDCNFSSQPGFTQFGTTAPHRPPFRPSGKRGL